MTEAEIKAAVFKVLARIAPEADPALIGPRDRLRAVLDIDSFDFLNLMVGLKRETGVDVPEADYGRVATLEELVNYLRAHAAEAPRTDAGGGS